MAEKKLGRTLWFIANVVMFLAFLFSTVVQLNDPDPIRWMGVYGAATAVCGLELRRGVRTWIPALLAVLALIWAATIAPRVIGKVGFSELFAEFEMRNAGVEEAREMYGLLFVALWMGVVAAVNRHRSTGRRTDEVPVLSGKP